MPSAATERFIDGFPEHELEKLSPEEQRKLRAAVREESKSDEKHKKRKQRAAAHIAQADERGRFATKFQVSSGPEEIWDRIISPDKDDLLVLEMDLVRALWANLPLELHRAAAARTIYGTLSVSALAAKLQMDEQLLKKQLVIIRRILRGVADPGGLRRRERALSMIKSGLSVRAVARLMDLPPSTVGHWKRKYG